jgi:hypothetical protein
MEGFRAKHQHWAGRAMAQILPFLPPPGKVAGTRTETNIPASGMAVSFQLEAESLTLKQVFRISSQF